MTNEQRQILQRINAYSEIVLGDIDPQKVQVSTQLEKLKPVMEEIAKEKNAKLLTTEKDWVRLPLAVRDQIKYARLDTVIFHNLKSNGVSLKHKETGRGVHMEFEQFPVIAFWTKGSEKAPYICLEPWHGCAAYDNESGNIFDKPHVICLQPGESKSLKYTVTLI